MARLTREERIEKNKRPWALVEWDDLATFIGPNAQRFERCWSDLRQKTLEKGYGMSRGFCWPAFLFSFAWYFARKQWLIGGLLLVLPIVMGMFLKSAGGALGISIAMAMMAKTFYLQMSIPKIAKILEVHPEGDQRDAALQAAGGISWPGAIIGGVILAIGYWAAIWTLMRLYTA